MTEVWDAIVIGGGLAGGAAAILLAQGGRRVLLLEREPAAHHKVCGEFISIEASAYLERLGLDLGILGAGAVTDISIDAPRGRGVTRTLPFTARSLSRYKLDAALLAQADRSGAIIRSGTTVTALDHDRRGWSVKTSRGHALRAPVVMLACGKHDLRGWPRPKAAQDFIGLKMHYRLSDAARARLNHGVRMFAFDGGYGGLEPVEDGWANLCIAVRKAAFAKAGKNWGSLVTGLTDAVPALRTLLADAAPRWDRPLAVSAIPYGYIYDGGGEADGLYRLGDQMAVIPSFCGDGMAIALHTAFAAAAACLNGGGSREYHKAMARQLRPQFRTARLLAAALMQPAFRRLALQAVRLMPRLLPWAIARTRIQGVQTS